jgi:predicted nucleic acid-binding protein
MRESFVIDTSIVMSWCFKDETNQYADIVLTRLSEATAFVPSIWPLEVVNVLLVAERKKRLSEADSIRFITLLSQLPIMVEHPQPERIMTDLLALARANNLSSYDASYLDLSMRKGIPIATLDARLIEAAKMAKVPIFMSETK